LNRYSYIFLIVLLLFQTSCKIKKGATTNNSKGISPTELKAKIIKASTEKVLANYDEAKTLYFEILELDPSVAVAHYELSEIFEIKRDADQAIVHAQKAVTLAPENEWYKSHLAAIYMQTSQFEKSVEVYDQLTQEYPDKIEYLYMKAENLSYLNKKEETLVVYDQIENILGISEELVLYKNKLYFELNQPEKAIEGLEKLIEAYPNEVRYYGLLAEVYENEGESEKALKYYSKILELEPNNGYVHLSLYSYYKYHGQQEQSYKELLLAFKNKEVRIEDKTPILSEYFINSEHNANIKKQGYELIEIARDTHPEEASVYAISADFYARDYKDLEALEMLEKAVALDGTNYNLWYQLMMVELVNNKYEKLATSSVTAIDLFPNQSTFYYFNGIANLQLEKYQSAIEQFEMGKDFVIDNPQLKLEFYQYLGDAYHQLGDDKNSGLNYDEALILDPNNVYVLNNYSYYLSLQKTKLDKAVQMSKKVNELSPNVATYQDTYGWVLFVAEKYDDAVIWLGKAVENGGQEIGEVLEHYGDALYKSGKTSEALIYWEKAKIQGGTSDQLDSKIKNKAILD